MISVLHSSPDRHLPSEIRHLAFVSQFTVDMHMLPGQRTPKLLYHSCTPFLFVSNIDVDATTQAQVNDRDTDQPQRDISSNLVVVPIKASMYAIPGYVLQDRPDPVVSAVHDYLTFLVLRNLARAGECASVRLVIQHFVWFTVKHGVRQWDRACLQYQRVKVHRHMEAATVKFFDPETHLHRVSFDLVEPLPPSHGYVYTPICVDHFIHWPRAIPISCST